MLPVEQVLVDSVHVVRIHRFALRERIVIIAQAGQHFYLGAAAHRGYSV